MNMKNYACIFILVASAGNLIAGQNLTLTVCSIGSGIVCALVYIGDSIRKEKARR